MGYTILLGFIALAGMIIYRSPDASQYAQIVIAATITLATTSVGYYFGSSSGSDKKSDVIASDSANKSASLANSTPALTPAPITTQTTPQDTADAAAAAEALRLKTAAP
jgi:hypothetical protein